LDLAHFAYLFDAQLVRQRTPDIDILLSSTLILST
jgi:hypothetical protein